MSRPHTSRANAMTTAWRLGLAVSAMSFAVATAQAEEKEKTYPRLEGELSIELQNDNTFKSQDPTAEINDLYNTTEFGGGFLITREFSVQTSLTFEPVLDPGPNDDRFFEDHGGYVEEIYGQYENDFFRIFAGKINPSFGKAWDAAPGIYGTDLAEDYEITERIGGGLALKAKGTAVGDLTLTGNIFFTDTSFLSNSVLTKRGRTRIGSGGPGNTEEFESFTVTLEGANIPGLPGVSFNAGFRHLQRGETPSDLGSENGFVAGLQGEHEFDGLKLEWIGEAVWIENYEGTLDDIVFATGGVKFSRDGYNVAFSGTARPRNVNGGPDLDDDLQVQVSAGKEIYDGWSLNGGYKYTVDGDIASHTVGLLLAKAITISLP